MSEQPTAYSIPDSRPLPTSDEVNVAALSRLFTDTTNSYKYVFFISLLDILVRRKFDISEPITFRELIIEMLANTWYPHTYFKLSFGIQDKVTETLDSLALEITEPILKFTDTDKKLLRETIAAQSKLNQIIRKLTRYVPFRLIIPFFETELKDIANRGKSNEADVVVPKVAEDYFRDRKPLYRFDSDIYSSCKAIVFHPAWAAYLEKHYSIIRGWASWEWLGYMQKRNPSTPALIYKLFAPSKRESLSEQTRYWKLILGSTDFYCIYSGRKLEIERFSLDHYLPWSFVAHDQLWNLIPTVPEINSSKSDNLPPDESFKKFVAAQHRSLGIWHIKLNKKDWNKTIEPYIENLGIHTEADLFDLEKLTSSYSNVVRPLISLASNQGFKFWQPLPAA